MLDWDTAQPNARYWALKMIIDNFRPGDKLVETSSDSGYVTAQAYSVRRRTEAAAGQQAREGIRGGPARPRGAKVEMIDLATGSRPPALSSIAGTTHQAGWIWNSGCHFREVRAKTSSGVHG